MDKTKTILFLCTGNYYRSRFAEYYFNHFAHGLPWRAKSRGLAIDPTNIGPISSYTVRELENFGIAVKEARFPVAVEEIDFEKADKIIVLNKTEHEPMIEKTFSRWQNKIVYWNINDLNIESTQIAFQKMKNLLDALIADLRVQ